MRGQVGYWGSGVHGGLCVKGGEDMLAWLDAQGTERRMLASVSRERRVILLPDREGGRLNHSESHRGQRYQYRYTSCTRPESLFLDVDVPPFELLEVEFEVELGCLSVELPPDHELPWPRLHVDCSSYEAERLALEALQYRLNSLIASGHTSFPADRKMPARLMRLLPPGTWADCLRAAKTLAGVS